MPSLLETLSPPPSFLNRESSSIPPFNPEEAYSIAYQDGRWCENCLLNSTKNSQRKCLAPSLYYCPGVLRLVVAYLDFYTDASFTNTLARTTCSKEALPFFIHRARNIPISDAENLAEAVNFWAAISNFKE